MSMEKPAENRLYHQMNQCAKAQLAMSGALVLGLAFFFFGVYRPQSQRLEDVEREVAQRHLELANDRTKTNRLPKVANELAELKARLANFKQLPPEPELGQFIHNIDSLSRKAGLPEPTVVPGETVTDELYSEQPIQLSFHGDFLSVFNFIHQVEDMERLTRVRDVTMHSIDGSPGVVDATVSVTIYYAED
ncbi:MAG TPA: type 4a pilus biogenesis protein PilO [Tepidisphaeraceae bacterium]|nr:type 4a pilus biogenesis protein PilO [Tepidisphaeraceae bacterium]